MNKKQANEFTKFLKKSIKINFPKFVKFDSLDLDTLEFYLKIPLEKRMSNSKEYSALSSKFNKWAKTFGYTEYGSGTGGDEYDIHFGPNDKTLNNHLRRIKKVLKNAIDSGEYTIDLKDIIKDLKNKIDSVEHVDDLRDFIEVVKIYNLLDCDEDLDLHIDVPVFVTSI